MGDETECAVGETTKKGWLGLGGLVTVTWDFAYGTMGQETENGCWLASMRMLYQWAKEQGKSKSPDDVKSLVTAGTFGGDANKFTQATISGLAKENRASAFKDLGMTTVDRATAAKWDMDTLLKLLDSNGPMIFTQAVTKTDGSGDFTTHAQVVRGASTEPRTPTVYVINPYDENALQAGHGPYKAVSAEWGFKVFLGNLPPSGSISAETALAYLT